jgi:hypothetical protein
MNEEASKKVLLAFGESLKRAARIWGIRGQKHKGRRKQRMIKKRYFGDLCSDQERKESQGND